jgi:hypothetical protein
MHRSRVFLRWIVAVSAVVGAGGGSRASAGDCFRQMGLGYSAGYHAPAPMAAPVGGHVHGWLGWKAACCHPGTLPAAGCGCGVAAPSCGACLPPAPTCRPPCDPGIPCCGGLFGLLNHCGVRNPGIY